MNLIGFRILSIYTHVANVRIGQRDNLPTITGVGQDLLVPGEGRVENDLSHGGADGTDGSPFEDGSVCKGENGCRQLGQQERTPVFTHPAQRLRAS